MPNTIDDQIEQSNSPVVPESDQKVDIIESSGKKREY